MPTPTATATINFGWSQLFRDEFSRANPSVWLMPDDWMPYNLGDTLALYIYETAARGVLLNTYENAAVQLDVIVLEGSAHLYLRASETDYYSAVVYASGQVSLYRGDRLLQTTYIANYLPHAWQTVRLSALDEQITVTVNDVPLIQYIETGTPLSEGQVAFSGDPTGVSKVMTDNLTLFVPMTDALALAAPAFIEQPEAETVADSVPLHSAEAMQILSSSVTNLAYSGLPSGSLIEDIFIMNPDYPTGPHVNVTNTPTLREYEPDISPDGRKLVYRIDNNLYVMDSANGYTVTQAVANGRQPRWALDNSGRLVFIRQVAGIDQIFVCTPNPTCTSVTQITNTAVIKGRPSWSRDGAYITYNLGNTNDVYRITIATGIQTNLTASSSAVNVAAQWNRVSSAYPLAFMSNRDFNILNVHLMDANGAYIKRITNVATQSIPGDVFALAWGPDGRLAYSTYDFTNGRGSTYYINNLGATAPASTLIMSREANWLSWGPRFVQVQQPTPTPTPGPGTALPPFEPQLPEFNVFLEFQDGSAPDDRDAIRDQVLYEVWDIAAALADTFPNFVGTIREGYNNDPDAFKRILAPGNQRITFVFMDLSDTVIPFNPNVPNPNTAAWRDARRVCPYILYSGGSQPASLVNTHNGEAALNPGAENFLPTVFQEMDTENLQHSALIVCDLQSSLQGIGRSVNDIRLFVGTNLGQLFAERTSGTPLSGVYPAGSFLGALQNASLLDDDNNVIFGRITYFAICEVETGDLVVPAPLEDVAVYAGIISECFPTEAPSGAVTDWVRGQRGWGSPAPFVELPQNSGIIPDVRIACGWQPNPAEDYDWEGIRIVSGGGLSGIAAPDAFTIFELKAAAGDMFLNWAHRRIGTNGAFANWNWINYPTCEIGDPPDPTNAGDARYLWMDGGTDGTPGAVAAAVAAFID
jgi:hypothetical protein